MSQLLVSRVAELERQLLAVRQQLLGAPLRPGTSGGRGAPPWVRELPEIPGGRGYREVVWCSAETLEGGTGDDQIWEVSALYDKWVPRGFLTSLSGVPGGEVTGGGEEEGEA